MALRVCQNVYAYIAMYIDRTKPKEHLGYIIDRTGFETFRSVVLDEIESDPPVRVVEPENPGYVYPRRELAEEASSGPTRSNSAKRSGLESTRHPRSNLATKGFASAPHTEIPANNG